MKSQPSQQAATEVEIAAPAEEAAVDEASPDSADVVFINGIVLTMDASRPQADALAIDGNRILAVGTEEDLSAFINDRTQVIDLGGRTLMPGFVDAVRHIFGEHLLYDQDPLPDQQMAIEFGVTTTADFYVDRSNLTKLITLADAGKLRMSVNAYLLYNNNCGELIGDWWKAYKPNQEIAPNLFIRGIKIFTDGGSCKIPAISVEYPGGGKGDLFLTQDELNQMVEDVHKASF